MEICWSKTKDMCLVPLEAASIKAPLGSNSTEVMPALLPVIVPRREH